LSNIYLTRFDKLLEGREHKFVRYADDCNIYLKSQRAAVRVMEGCVEFLEGKRMGLKVNREKSAVGSPESLKFLGFTLYTRKDGSTGVREHPKSAKWIQYYGIADMEWLIKRLNGWIRRRLRQYIWKQWKTTKARTKNLVKLGVPRRMAQKWANARAGYWRIAGSPILSSTITNKRLEKRGYGDIFKKYEAVHSRYQTAVYRPVRTVV